MCHNPRLDLGVDGGNGIAQLGDLLSHRINNFVRDCGDGGGVGWKT